MTKRILVTGGAGFIGSHIVDLFIDKGHKVAVVDNLCHGKKENINKKAVFFEEDVVSPKIRRIFEKFKPEIISHQAALVSVPVSLKHPLNDLKVNVSGTLQVLEAAKKFKAKRVIFASSVAVYGEVKKLPVKENTDLMPISVYGLSKVTAEHYCKLYRPCFRTTILRYANVYGLRQDSSAEGGVAAIFVNAVKNKRPCYIYGTGGQTRDFVYVKDVARANYLAAAEDSDGTFNISSNVATSINSLYLTCCRISGKIPKPNFKPRRAGDIKHSLLANELVRRKIGWFPRFSLTQGLLEIFAVR